MMFLKLCISLANLCLSKKFIIEFSKDFGVNNEKEIYDNRVAFHSVEKGGDYQEGDLYRGKVNESCKTINGPGQGKPCIFPFTYLGKAYNSCMTVVRFTGVQQRWMTEV